MNSPEGTNYVIVSPAKDEGLNIETTIQAILKQTIRPSLWVIVDDGSQDDTCAIVERYMREYPWIRLISGTRRGKREYGAPVIEAFLEGYELVRDAGYDFIVKLDCDLDFAPDYFEQLIARFRENSALGIASGIYLEKYRGGDWRPVQLPDYHAAGASKMIRAKCYEDINGFAPVFGWDTIDQIRAQMAGWETRHFDELTFHHLRYEGSGVGLIGTNIRRGEGYYLTGGGLSFFLLKALHRTVYAKPFLIVGALMFFGYLRAWMLRKPRVVTSAEAKFYRNQLNRRIHERAGRWLAPLAARNLRRKIV
jgi:biofilm PGA synthesis N-glycosyltransferase PgaC